MLSPETLLRVTSVSTDDGSFGGEVGKEPGREDEVLGEAPSASDRRSHSNSRGVVLSR